MTRDNLAARVAADTAHCSPADICKQAVDVLDRVLAYKPAERLHEIDQAERLAVRLRDCLIDRYRRADEAGKAHMHPGLKQANVAVSLLVGVEYPGAGVQEQPLQQAREVLRGMLDREWV